MQVVTHRSRVRRLFIRQHGLAGCDQGSSTLWTSIQTYLLATMSSETESETSSLLTITDSIRETLFRREGGQSELPSCALPDPSARLLTPYLFLHLDRIFRSLDDPAYQHRYVRSFAGVTLRPAPDVCPVST